MTTHDEEEPDRQVTDAGTDSEAADVAGATSTAANPRVRVEQLQHLLGAVIQRLTVLEQSHRRVSAAVDTADHEGPPAMDPAPWVWYVPPELTADPQANVHLFVAWYNEVYVGSENGRARPIPACWDQHPGLAMEIAALAALWHSANRGRGATPRDAQTWHHQWRPAFINRLPEWIHPHCLDGYHRVAGAAPRTNRFAPAPPELGGDTNGKDTK